MVPEEVRGRAWIWTKVNLLQNPHPSQHTLLPEENKIRSESRNLAFESITFSGKFRRAEIINTSPSSGLAPVPLGQQGIPLGLSFPPRNM